MQGRLQEHHHNCLLSTSSMLGHDNMFRCAQASWMNESTNRYPRRSHHNGIDPVLRSTIFAPNRSLLIPSCTYLYHNTWQLSPQTSLWPYQYHNCHQSHVPWTNITHPVFTSQGPASALLLHCTLRRKQVTLQQLFLVCNYQDHKI